MVWLNRGSANPSLESYVSSFYKLDHSMLCNMLGREDLKCVVVMFERSSSHLFLYLLLFNKKQKMEQQGLYRFEHREPKSYFFNYLYYYNYLLIKFIFILFFLPCVFGDIFLCVLLVVILDGTQSLPAGNQETKKCKQFFCYEYTF